MKVLGITAEYNPFHNGHRYHLEKALEATCADYTVAVMSGNFTQRGEPVILDKWTRSRLAVENGIDLVFELPFVFACNRAECFASGAVDILSLAGVTDIAFGSENGDTEQIRELVRDINKNEESIYSLRKTGMKSGNSFAKANHNAVRAVLGEEKAVLMEEPNNILAMEYIRRIDYWEHRGYHIEPHAVKRHGADYRTYNEAEGFAGAAAIRSMLCQGKADYNTLAKYVPENVAEALRGIENHKRAQEREFLLLKGELLRKSGDELSEIYCVGEGIESKLKKEIVRAESMEEIVSAVTSRRYTGAAVRRILTYILMGIKGKEPACGYYGRVLAAGEKGRKYLRMMKNDDSITLPLITNVNKEAEACEKFRSSLERDFLASDIYNLTRGRNIYDFSDRVVRPYMA